MYSARITIDTKKACSNFKSCEATAPAKLKSDHTPLLAKSGNTDCEGS